MVMTRAADTSMFPPVLIQCAVCDRSSEVSQVAGSLNFVWEVVSPRRVQGLQVREKTQLAVETLLRRTAAECSWVYSSAANQGGRLKEKLDHVIMHLFNLDCTSSQVKKQLSLSCLRRSRRKHNFSGSMTDTQSAPWPACVWLKSFSFAFPNKRVLPLNFKAHSLPADHLSETLFSDAV